MYYPPPINVAYYQCVTQIVAQNYLYDYFCGSSRILREKRLVHLLFRVDEPKSEPFPAQR